MLYRKHLQPWLLIYLIVSFVLFLTAIGIVFIIIYNQISGIVNFNPQTQLLCPQYVYQKLQTYTESILRICSISSVIASIIALAQLFFTSYLFIIFRKTSKQSNQNQYDTFEQITAQKLIFLYILASLGLMSLVVIFGSYFSFYIQFQTCDSLSNYSSSYLMPWIISGSSILTQLVLFILALKFIYHLRESQKSNQNQNDEEQDPYQRQKRQLQEAKRKILDSGAKKTKTQLLFDSIGQQTPRNMMDKTLLQKMQNDAYSGRNPNSIYNNNPFSEDQKIQNMSPNAISTKQKELLKTLPKYHSKNYKSKQKNSPKSTIFQQGQMQNVSFDEEYQFKDPSNQKLQIQTSAPFNIRSQKYPLQNQNPPTPNFNPGNTQKSNQDMSKLFNERYKNSPYLKYFQNKNISPQQRRSIKRPFLTLTSNVIDLNPKKNNQNHDLKTNDPRQIKLFNINKTNPKKSVKKTMSSSQYIAYTNQRKSNSRFKPTSYYLQQSLKQGRKLQNQNPLQNYVNDDQVHEDYLNRMQNFEKIGKRQRRSFISNPFTSTDKKEEQGKLYLHKNKHDAQNKNNALDFDQDENYDPYRDQTYDHEILIYRGISDDQRLRSSTKNMNKTSEQKKTNTNNNKETEFPLAAKKISKKDSHLLDYIRSKYVTD